MNIAAPFSFCIYIQISILHCKIYYILINYYQNTLAMGFYSVSCYED